MPTLILNLSTSLILIRTLNPSLMLTLHLHCSGCTITHAGFAQVMRV